jgi:hypothetical protein
MDVLAKNRKSGDLEQVGVIDVTDLLIESDDDLLVALFDEALDGFAVPVEQDDPRGGFELVRLSPSDPGSVAAFQNFIESHGFVVKDAQEV